MVIKIKRQTASLIADRSNLELFTIVTFKIIIIVIKPVMKDREVRREKLSKMPFNIITK